jgi:hypothetical protein
MRLALTLAVWWGVPTALVWMGVRRRAGARVAAVGALLPSVAAAAILLIVLRSDSSTAAIGLFTLAPLVWAAPVFALAVGRWRKVPSR